DLPPHPSPRDRPNRRTFRRPGRCASRHGSIVGPATYQPPDQSRPTLGVAADRGLGGVSGVAAARLPRPLTTPVRRLRGTLGGVRDLPAPSGGGTRARAGDGPPPSL